MIKKLLIQQNAALKQQGLYRTRALQDELASGINFSSNDYLSLRNDKQIQQAFQKGFAKYPAGSGASMVVCGYHGVHQALEKRLANELEVEKAVLFNSGYVANLSIMSLLSRLKLSILVDKAVHASVYDGLKLAGATYQRYLHNNVAHLQKKITKNQAIVTESVFSMSGQQADLCALRDCAANSQGILVVDEAHAFGILGPRGLGAIAQYQFSQEVLPLRMLSFGKAMGSQGAVVAGQEDWILGLIQASRPHIYSTGMSPALSYGLLESFEIILKADARRKKLFELVEYFCKLSKKSPLKWRDSKTPIQQLQLGCPFKALDCALRLQKLGIHCLPMRPPTVSLPETGLRVVLNYDHEAADIDNLFKQLHHIYDAEH